MKKPSMEEYIRTQLPQIEIMPNQDRDQSKDEVYLIADQRLEEKDTPCYNQEPFHCWGHWGSNSKIWSSIRVVRHMLLSRIFKTGMFFRLGCKLI